jgi:hypothetical protein
MRHLRRKGELHTGFWWGDLRKRDHFEDLGVDWIIILEWIFKKWDGEARAELIWVRIGISAGIL